MRLARAFTGKPKVIRFRGHFHGWHDGVTAGAMSHFEGGVPSGIPAALVEQTILLPADDISHVVQAFAARSDIAAVLIEPSGASWGQVPLATGFLAKLHDITRSQGAVLVFDEVITGFRWSRGGAQQRYAVTPDLCVLAKIVAGGLPGGAVAGRADIMDRLDAAAAKAAGHEKVGHQGTFNANPLSAAAAVATLSIVETEDVCAKAERTAADIRDGLSQILVEEQVPWGVYGEASAFLLFQNPGKLDIDPAAFDPIKLGFAALKGARNPNLAYRLRVAMLANGVDFMGAPGGRRPMGPARSTKPLPPSALPFAGSRQRVTSKLRLRGWIDPPTGGQGCVGCRPPAAMHAKDEGWSWPPPWPMSSCARKHEVLIAGRSAAPDLSLLLSAGLLHQVKVRTRGAPAPPR
jgi:glutamate-1-semialdehyde 2,1-aminomutase